MNKTSKPTANEDSAPNSPLELDKPGSANLESIKLIDEPGWDDVSGEVTFDERGNAIWQRHAENRNAEMAFKAEREDSILKHIDFEDLRIVETSDLHHVGTMSGKLDLGQRFSDRHNHKPAKKLFSWLQKENGNTGNTHRPGITTTAATSAQHALGQDALNSGTLNPASLALDSAELDPLTRDYLKKHGAPAPSPRQPMRREPALLPHDSLPVLTSPITREQLTRKAVPAMPTDSVNRAAIPPAKPTVTRTEPAAAPNSAPSLAAMLERMGRR